MIFWRGFGWRRRNSFRYKLGGVLCVILVIAVLIGCLGIRSFISKSLYPMKYSELVSRYCSEYSLSVELVYAVILCESGFDEKALSGAGACGLMQLMPATFEWISDICDLDGDADIFEPEANIRAGCAYIRYLYGRFEATETVLAAYNAGEGRVSAWLKDPKYSSDGVSLDVIPYPETVDYVNKVCEAVRSYRITYNKK